MTVYVYVCTKYVYQSGAILNNSLWIDARMADHHVAIQRDGCDGKQRHRRQAVAQQREQATQHVAVRPRTVPVCAGRQRQIEAAEQKISQRQIDDEEGGGITDLFDKSTQMRLTERSTTRKWRSHIASHQSASFIF